MEAMPCGSCPGGVNNPVVNVVENSDQPVTTMEGEMVRVEYMLDSQGRHNTGQHLVRGVTAFQNLVPSVPMKKKSGVWYMDYGQRKCGEIFIIHRKDLEGMPSRFREIVEESQVSVNRMPQIAQPAEAPVRIAPSPTAERLRAEADPAHNETHMKQLERMKPSGPHPAAVAIPKVISTSKATSTVPIDLDKALDKAPQPTLPANSPAAEAAAPTLPKPKLPSVLADLKFDLQTIPGITTNIAEQMKAAGIDNLEALASLQIADLIKYNGIADRRATMIVGAVQEMWREHISQQQTAKLAESTAELLEPPPDQPIE